MGVECEVNRDGKAHFESGCGYLFWSTKADRGFWLNIIEGEIQLGSEVDEPKNWYQPIPKEFIDSDQAMASAIQHGFVPDERNFIHLYNHERPEGIPETLCWVIKGFEREYYISGKTGKYLSKLP